MIMKAVKQNAIFPLSDIETFFYNLGASSAESEKIPARVRP